MALKFKGKIICLADLVRESAFGNFLGDKFKASVTIIVWLHSYYNAEAHLFLIHSMFLCLIVTIKVIAMYPLP